MPGHVLGFGALNWDRLIHVESLKHLDTELSAIDEVGSPGGSAANTIFGLAKLGVRASYIGTVGADPFGRRIVKSFKTVGVNCSAIKARRGSSSGEALCLSDRRSRRLIVIEPGANSLYSSADLTTAMDSIRRDSPTITHFSSFVGKSQLPLQIELASFLSSRGVVTCSPGAIYIRHGIEVLRPLLAASSYLFFNRAEVTELVNYGFDDYEMAASALLAEFPRCRAVIVTLGRGEWTGKTGEGIEQLLLSSLLNTSANGRQRSSSVVVSRTSIVRTPATTLGPVKDTTGAGDAYAAGFLYGVLRNYDLARSALSGHIAAQHSILELGARAGLPTEDELQVALADADLRRDSLEVAR